MKRTIKDSSQIKSIFLKCSLITLFHFLNAKSFPFGADLCFKDGTWINCLQAEGCGPGDSNKTSCLLKATLYATKNSSAIVRSSMHFDSIYVIAQAIGFTPEAAYWLAAYNNAVDAGSYVPLDLQGKQLADSSYSTADISGWANSNTITGGILAHFAIYYNADGTSATNGLYPNLSDAVHEGTVYHNRQWGLFGTLPGCVGGITNFDISKQSYFSGSTCYQNALKEGLSQQANPATIPQFIEFTMPTIASYGTPQYSGDSVFQSTSASKLGSTYITSAKFDSDLSVILQNSKGRLNGKPVPVSIVRFSIYLHSLMDRISHHLCIDESPTGPPAKDGTWELNYTGPHCAQTQHGYNHTFELGVAPLSERTYSALNYMYRELAIFKQLHPEFSRSGFTPIPLEQILGSVTQPKTLDSALQAPSACGRIQGMRTALQKFGLNQMPGQSLSAYPTCPGQ